jgi:hypothetical protein
MFTQDESAGSYNVLGGSMRKSTVFNAALFGGAVSLFLAAAPSHAQTVLNPDFENPNPPTTGVGSSTDTVATSWVLSPAVGDDYTNPGQRCTFANPTPSGGTWSFWLQTFVQDGFAAQVVPGVTAGNVYDLSAQMAFEVPGYNNVTLANQASDPNTQDTGNLYSYLELQYEHPNGSVDGAPYMLQIPAGSVTTANHVYAPYDISGLAPAGATQAELLIGWQNGGLDGNTGGQSAFATSVALNQVVPEPASLSLVAVGSLALFARRRAKSSV